MTAPLNQWHQDYYVIIIATANSGYYLQQQNLISVKYISESSLERVNEVYNVSLFACAWLIEY